MHFNWYVINVYSGSEDKVMLEIQNRAKKKSIMHLIKDIVIPKHSVYQIKQGKKVKKEATYLPGYILIHAELSDQLWHLIRAIPRVTGFLSSGKKPQILSETEVAGLLEKAETDSKHNESNNQFSVAETVKISDGGAFHGFIGEIKSIDQEKQNLTLSVAIFDRPTSIIINWDLVEKQ